MNRKKTSLKEKLFTILIAAFSGALVSHWVFPTKYAALFAPFSITALFHTGIRAVVLVVQISKN